jgi:hypothetical protein
VIKPPIGGDVDELESRLQPVRSVVFLSAKVVQPRPPSIVERIADPSQESFPDIQNPTGRARLRSRLASRPYPESSSDLKAEQVLGCIVWRLVYSGLKIVGTQAT